MHRYCSLGASRFIGWYRLFGDKKDRIFARVALGDLTNGQGPSKIGRRFDESFHSFAMAYVGGSVAPRRPLDGFRVGSHHSEGEPIASAQARVEFRAHHRDVVKIPQ